MQRLGALTVGVLLTILIGVGGCAALAPLARVLLSDVAPTAVDVLGSVIKNKLSSSEGGCAGLDGVEDEDGYVFAVCSPGVDVGKAAPVLVGLLDGPLSSDDEAAICYELDDVRDSGGEPFILCKARAQE